jgi:hypothetical protein
VGVRELERIVDPVDSEAGELRAAALSVTRLDETRHL